MAGSTNGKEPPGGSAKCDCPSGPGRAGQKELYMGHNGNVTGTGRRWYILRHLKPNLIDDIFARRAQVSHADGEQSLPAFDYFIPYCDIHYRPSMRRHSGKEAERYNPTADGDALRSDLRSYIFVCGTENLVADILAQSWARHLTLPLWAMHDRDGRLVSISDRRMQLFRTCISQLDFTICEGRRPASEVARGDRVDIVGGPMEGAAGVISDIVDRRGRITLTILFRLFDGMEVLVPGFSVDNVMLTDRRARSLLHEHALSNFESELIELLCHRHGERGSAELSKADRRQLEFLNRYAGMQFADPADAARFKALMLICAYLLNDTALLRQRTEHVQALLKGVTDPATHEECYLMTALFIATHDVALRHRVKAYRQQHPDCPLAIRRFQSIAKKIRV